MGLNDLFDRFASRELFENVLDRYTGSGHDGLSHHHIGVGNYLVRFHALNYTAETIVEA